MVEGSVRDPLELERLRFKTRRMTKTKIVRMIQAKAVSLVGPCASFDWFQTAFTFFGESTRIKVLGEASLESPTQ